MVDLTGPLTDSNKQLYRFIASYDDNGSFRDYVRNSDLLLAPSFTFVLSDRSALTFEGEYRRNRGHLDQGLMAPKNDINFVAPIHVRYQEPDDSTTNNGMAVAGYLTKGFANGLTLNTTWRSVWQSDERIGLENNRVEPNNRSVRRRDRHQVSERQNHSVDTTLSTIAATGTLRHNLLLGFGGSYGIRDLDRRRFGNVGFLIDLYNPVYGQYVLPADGKPGSHQYQTLASYNVYAQDRVDLASKWKALLAFRYEGLDTKVEELRLPEPDRSRFDHAAVPTVGLVFQPDQRWSVYGSYATSFDPQTVTALDVNGQNTFDPEKGQQLEGGVKFQSLAGKFDATLSVFDIVKSNVLVEIEGGYYEQIGEERSQGAEVDLRLQPWPGFQAILGYTYTDARVTQDKATSTRPSREGAQLINSAKNAFNVWARYDLTNTGALRGLGFGVGLIYRGYRPGTFPGQVIRGDPVPGQPMASTVIDLPGYFRADLGIYYARPRYEVTLHVNNVADKLYYESAFNTIQIRPGRPREATLSMRVRF